MIDLRLVGYTADLKHLVLDLRSGTGRARYRLPIDPDLFATLDTVRDARREVGLPVGDPEEYEDWGDEDDEDDWEDDEDDGDDWEDDEDDGEDDEGDGDGDEAEGNDGDDGDDDPSETDDLDEVSDESPDDADDDWDEDWGDEDDWEEGVEPALGITADEEDELPEDGLVDTSTGTEPALVDWLDDDLDAEWNLERAPRRDDRGAVTLVPRDDRARDWDGREDDGNADEGEEDDADLRDGDRGDDDPHVHVVADAGDRVDRAAEIRSRAARPGLDARAEGPALSPLEIQALLRQGRSVRSVAKAAGTSVEWVERWLGPIEAEREQVIAAAQRLRLERARLGRSREPMGAAVARHLKEKGLGPADVTWEAARRKDGRWRVSARFVHRRRTTQASWLFDPVRGTIEAANDAGNQLGFTRRQQRR